MIPYRKHLYAIMYPNEGLVASQLGPADFADSYAVGSARFYRGKMLFFELDLEFRHPYFPIDEYLEQTVEHPDGRPKRTKFIRTYRVLEHLDLAALKALYAVAVSGQALMLERAEMPEVGRPLQIRLYQLLAPTGMLYATPLTPTAFASYSTTEGYTKGAPTVFFTQYRLHVARFRERWEHNPYISSPINGLHPAKLKEVLDKLVDEPHAAVRSVGIQSLFLQNSYRRIENGFWVGRGNDLAFFRMPDPVELRRRHEAWYNSIA